MRCICTARGAETTMILSTRLIAAGFQQQRNVEHHGAAAMAPGARNESLFLLPDHRMQDALQPGQRIGLAQHSLTQRHAVHRAVPHCPGKRRRDRPHCLAAASLHSVYRGVGVEYRDVRPTERCGSG